MPIKMNTHDIQATNYMDLDSFINGDTSVEPLLGEYGSLLQQSTSGEGYMPVPREENFSRLDDMLEIIEQDQEQMLMQPNDYEQENEKPPKQSSELMLPLMIEHVEWTDALAAEKSMNLHNLSTHVHSPAASDCTDSSPVSPYHLPPTRATTRSPPANLAPLAVNGKPVDSDRVMSVLGMTEEELASLKSADVEKTFSSFGKPLLANIKKRRRTIKNRKYAQSSRLRKKQRDSSSTGEASVLRQELDEARRELEYRKSRCRCGLQFNDNQHPIEDVSLDASPVWTNVNVKKERYDPPTNWTDSPFH